MLCSQSAAVPAESEHSEKLPSGRGVGFRVYYVGFRDDLCLVLAGCSCARQMATF